MFQRGLFRVIKQQQKLVSLNKNLSFFRFSNNFDAQKVESILKEILQNNPKCEDKEIQLSDKFEDLGLDSLERVEIIAEVEEAMDIDIDDEAATSIITVEDAINIFLKSSQ